VLLRTDTAIIAGSEQCPISHEKNSHSVTPIVTMSEKKRTPVQGCLGSALVAFGAFSLLAMTPLMAAQQATPGKATQGKHQEPAGEGQPPNSLEPLQPRQPLPDGEGEWTRWTAGRYRITPGDIIELRFPFVPELDQTIAVQPDGYATLREVGDMRVQGRTVPELRADLHEAYGSIVRDLVFTVVLKEFEKPYFVVSGEITRPGRYDLRGATTLTQALAYAGGPTIKGKTTEVVIFRSHTESTVSVRQVDVKAMYSKRDLSEDPLLYPGDTVFVPITKLGKLAPVLSRLGLGMYLNPMDLIP
jgi:polysaccharide export outer membrane protein